jgi:hypothetical protein
LLQVVPTRLIQAVRNKLLRACCHQPVNNLLRADDIRLVGTTCWESVVRRWQQLIPDLSTTGNKQCEHILLTSCEIFACVIDVHMEKSRILPTSHQQLVFALLVPNCQQIGNKLWTNCSSNLADTFRLVAMLFRQVRCSHDITILLQSCVVNLVTFLLYHECNRLVRTAL